MADSSETVNIVELKNIDLCNININLAMNYVIVIN